jgi:hypothetical protein
MQFFMTIHDHLEFRPSWDKAIIWPLHFPTLCNVNLFLPQAMQYLSDGFIFCSDRMRISAGISCYIISVQVYVYNYGLLCHIYASVL